MTNKRIEAAAREINLGLKKLLGGKNLPPGNNPLNWSASWQTIDLEELAQAALAAADAVDTEKQELIEVLRAIVNPAQEGVGNHDNRLAIIKAREVLKKHGGK